MTDESSFPGHDGVRDRYDDVHSQGVYEEGMARMALYHRHCQDPVVFRALGDVRGRALLDLACGDGFYTRRFRADRGADPVVGIDLSPEMIARARAIERREPLGIEYRVGDVTSLRLEERYDVVTAIHLLHYLNDREEIATVLGMIRSLLEDGDRFVTMVANPEFDLDLHDPADSKEKFGYYFSAAEPGNGGRLRFHPGGFPEGRELTFELRRWKRGFLDEIAREVGFEPEWRDPFISDEGLREHGPEFFENYLASPQSVLLRLVRVGGP